MNLFRVLDPANAVGLMVVAERREDISGLVEAIGLSVDMGNASVLFCAADIREEPQVLAAFKIKGAGKIPPTTGSNSQQRSAEYRRRRRQRKRENRREVAA